jgi:DNA-binding winged helix-turn-helix (wHTH) protein
MAMSSTGSQEFSTTRDPLLPPVYEFDNFRLEPGNRLLLRDGKAVPLPPRAIDVLAVLVAAGGRLVTKDEFLRTLWPGLAVEEGNLTQYMFLLRKGLEEDREGRRYIDRKSVV